MSEKSWQAYAGIWDKWEGVLRQVGGCQSPEEYETALLYFVGLAYENNLSFSGVSQRMAAVAFWLKARGLQDISKSFLVRQALKGYRKRGGAPDRRRPVSYRLLEQVCDRLSLVCSSEFEVFLFRAAFSLAFFGAFRVSELVASNKKVVGGLLRADVEVSTESLVCRLRRSKVDQWGKGSRVFLYCLVGSEVCPVLSVTRFLALRPEGPKGLLVHQDGSALSRYQFLAVFRRCLRGLGLEDKEFCTHSFRIGAATEAARWGLDDTVIKRIGRWESSRFRGYVRPQLL